MNSTILLVSPPHRRMALQQLLMDLGLQVFAASDLREAQQKLNACPCFNLVLADTELPDGPWQNLLRFLQNSNSPCEMIVCSRCGDEKLWTEVLRCGAYDLLVEPYERQEVRRIIANALERKYVQVRIAS